nr:ADP-ribosyltransferase domain-containing protein [uncultured Pseudomonas sp.]
MDMNSISNFLDTHYPASPTQEAGSSSPSAYSSFFSNPDNYTNPYDYASSSQTHNHDYPYHDSQLLQYGYESPPQTYSRNDSHNDLSILGGGSQLDTHSDDDLFGNSILGRRLADFDTSDFTLKSDLKKLLKKDGFSSKGADEYIDGTLKDRKYKPESSALNSNEYVSIALYAGGLFRPVNKMLRDKPHKVDNPVVQSLNSGLAKLAEDPDKVKNEVHRGIKKNYSDKQVQKEFKVGKTYTDSSFMSTSTSPSVAARFTGSVQLHIAAKSAVSIDSISGFGGMEKEALIPPNTQMTVTDLKKAGNVWHVDLEEK